MGIIIGAMTTISFSQGTCVTQASWSASPNTQRLYCVGSWTPYDTIEKPTETLNLTVYSPGNSFDITPSTSCEIASQATASIDPAGCGGGSEGPTSTSWHVNSYSFSKDDAQMPGTESWSMMQYIGTNTPDYVLRGISEGSASGDAGITFTGSTTTSAQGSVSAGQVGRSDELILGQVSSVGGGSSTQGEIGQGSVSIPLTPMWL
jgi:hypothetical protein